MSNEEVQSGKSRPYVVLEEGSLVDTIEVLLREAAIDLSTEQWEAVEAECAERKIYSPVCRAPSRNAAHALRQAGRQYERGTTPPLVAVSERMFKPRQVTVDFEPKVSLA